MSALLRELTDGGLGVTSLRRTHATLRSALADAVRAQLVWMNVAAVAMVPKRIKTKVRPWESEDLGPSSTTSRGTSSRPHLRVDRRQRGYGLARRWDFGGRTSTLGAATW